MIYKKIEVYNSLAENRVVNFYFDGKFQADYLPPNGSTYRAIEEAVLYMEQHHFQYVDILNAETGELLAIINVCHESDPDDE